MNTSESKQNLVFNHNTIRLIIGIIALSFPWLVYISATEVTRSLSWSYHTGAHDIFVGFLFVIGAFLISYKGHKPELRKDEIGKFWNWLNKFWKGGIKFRIWERKHEEDLVGWIGGVAALVTALCPTRFCQGETCPPDPKSTIHYIAAAILFSTTVYFCLVAFKSRAKAKRKAEGLHGKRGCDPKNLRIKIYSVCGWGIAVIMVATVIVTKTGFAPVKNILFYSEAAALELFGLGWLIASQSLPFFTDKKERPKIF